MQPITPNQRVNDIFSTAFLVAFFAGWTVLDLGYRGLCWIFPDHQDR